MLLKGVVGRDAVREWRDNGDDNFESRGETLSGFPLPGGACFVSVKKIASCHATCSPFSLARHSDRRSWTPPLTHADSFLRDRWQYSQPPFSFFMSPFFYPFYIAILPTRVVGDQTSNKLPYKCHTYVKYLASEEFDIIIKISVLFHIRISLY